MNRNASAGFTLIEALVAIAVLAILLGIAVPSFSDSTLNSQLRAASTDMIAAANLARTEAIKRRRTVSLCVSSNGTSCTTGGWHQGWIVIVPSTGTVIRTRAAMRNGFRMSEANSLASVAFQSTGVGATAAAFRICRATPSPGPQERVVTIDAAGRAVARRTTTGTCS